MSRRYPISPDPSTSIDFVFGWRDPAPGPWLEVAETITAQQVTVSPGLVLGTGPKAPAVNDGDVRIWLTPGATLAVGERLWADCRITTSLGRTDTRRIELVVAQR